MIAVDDRGARGIAEIGVLLGMFKPGNRAAFARAVFDQPLRQAIAIGPAHTHQSAKKTICDPNELAIASCRQALQQFNAS